MVKKFSLLLSSGVLFLCIPPSVLSQVGQPQRVNASRVESGKFRFYETKQPLGEETYEIKRTSNGSIEASANVVAQGRPFDTSKLREVIGFKR